MNGIGLWRGSWTGTLLLFGAAVGLLAGCATSPPVTGPADRD